MTSSNRLLILRFDGPVSMKIPWSAKMSAPRRTSFASTVSALTRGDGRRGDGPGADTLHRRADERLYARKRAGLLTHRP
jgi:hypothetical protein